MTTNDSNNRLRMLALSAIALGMAPMPSGGTMRRLPRMRSGNKYAMGHDTAIRNANGTTVRGKRRNQKCERCGFKAKRCRCAAPATARRDGEGAE